ncbi:MAG: ECF-type sigma factor [Thermoanaerobaculia bacterium]|nr:ECF-type sigma factor [Thermoanaerobaculia bacterium]
MAGERGDMEKVALRGEPHPAGLSSATRADLDETFADLYEEARLVARRTLRSGMAPWRRDATMNTTALVNEAYLRLQGRDSVRWNDRDHFLALVARAMRFAFVDYARAHHRAKRGGTEKPVSLDDPQVPRDPSMDQMLEDILSLDQALERLAETSQRLARVVECRFIVGLSVEETASALGVSGMTIKRDWISAKALLARELKSGPDDGEDRGVGVE